MRTCFNCNGKGEVAWCEDEPLDTCAVCKGTGECEDDCYCAAFGPLECSCGGWDDVDIDDWYGCGYECDD